MRAILTILFLVLLIAAIADYLKRRREKLPRPSPLDTQRMIAADAAPPTETGRMRVQSIMEAIKNKEGETAAPSAVEQPTAETEEELPDPFESEKSDS